MQDNTPTQRTYDSLNQAYEHFNTTLFGGTLPPCLITMQRRHGSYGYFAAERFANPDSPADTIDEIALNPALFTGRRPMAILATLVQEMVHAWQYRYGKPGRLGYHNRAGARKMIEIGLVPTDTGQSGGKETGQRMSCYEEPGGAFEHACRVFLDGSDVVFYYDQQKEGEEAKQTSRKTRYICPNCKVRAWARSGVSLRCEDCDRTLLATPVQRARARMESAPSVPVGKAGMESAIL